MNFNDYYYVLEKEPSKSGDGEQKMRLMDQSGETVLTAVVHRSRVGVTAVEVRSTRHDNKLLLSLHVLRRFLRTPVVNVRSGDEAEDMIGSIVGNLWGGIVARSAADNDVFSHNEGICYCSAEKLLKNSLNESVAALSRSSRFNASKWFLNIYHELNTNSRLLIIAVLIFEGISGDILPFL